MTRTTGLFLFGTVLLLAGTKVPVTAASKAPKAGAACSVKELGKKSGALVCSKKGTKRVWQVASSPATAAAATEAPAVTAPPASKPREIRKVTVTGAAAFTNVGGVVMVEKGIDKKYGLSVSSVNVASGADIARALLSGDVQITANSPPNIISLKDNGADVVILGQTLMTSQFDLVVRNDFATPNASKGWQGAMKDLAGARIGVIARGVANEDVVRYLFRAAGVNPDGQTYIATGLAGTTLAALQNKQIDAAINVEPTISQAIKNGLGRAPFYLRRNEGPEQLNWPGTYSTALRDWATKNPDIIKDYLAAVEEANAWVADPANKVELYKIMKDKMGLDAADADLLFAENKGIFPKSTKVEIPRLQNFLDFSNSSGISLQRRKPSDFLLS